MTQNKRYDKAKCAIKLCIVICAFSIGGALLYYCNALHGVTNNTSWDTWYNFLSPIIAIANIIAFIGLTAAIYYGETKRQEQFEKTHIEETILTKICYIEQKLTEVEKELRTSAPALPTVYTAYIIVYRARYYFEKLNTIEILGETEKTDAADMLESLKNMEEEMARSYNTHKDNNTQYTLEEGKQLSKQLNHLTGKLNMMEADMMQQMAKNIGTNAPEPI